MTEAELTTKHTGQLRKLHPNWVVLKHCDRFTSGIPDVSVSLGIKTVWVEYKLLKKDEELNNPVSWINNLAQLEQTKRLFGFYLAYDPKAHNCIFATAAFLEAKYLSQGVLEQGVVRAGDGFGYLYAKLFDLLSEDQ